MFFYNINVIGVGVGRGLLYTRRIVIQIVQSIISNFLFIWCRRYY